MMNDPIIKFEVTVMDSYGHLFYESFDGICEAVDFYRKRIKEKEDNDECVDLAVEIGGEDGDCWVVESHLFSQ